MKPPCKSRQRKPRGYSAGLLNLRRNMNQFFKIPADVFHRNSDVSVGKDLYTLLFLQYIGIDRGGFRPCEAAADSAENGRKS